MNVLVLICYILHVLLWRSGVYIQGQLQASRMVKSERTQEKWTQQPPHGFHLSWILLQLCSLTSLVEKSTVPKYSSFWVYWPLFSCLPYSGSLESWSIFLSHLLNSAVKSLPPCLSLQLTRFHTHLPVAVKGNDSRISHGPGSQPAWKTYWVDVSQSPVFSSGVPISLGSADFLHLWWMTL